MDTFKDEFSSSWDDSSSHLLMTSLYGEGLTRSCVSGGGGGRQVIIIIILARLEPKVNAVANPGGDQGATDPPFQSSYYGLTTATS